MREVSTIRPISRHRNSWTLAASLAGTVILCVGSLGCQTSSDEDSLRRQSLSQELRRACIQARGGPHMDAVDLYGGNLNRLCAHWAYKRAREALPKR